MLQVCTFAETRESATSMHAHDTMHTQTHCTPTLTCTTTPAHTHPHTHTPTPTPTHTHPPPPPHTHTHTHTHITQVIRQASPHVLESSTHSPTVIPIVAGVVVGGSVFLVGVLLTAVLALGCWCYYRKKQKYEVVYVLCRSEIACILHVFK